MKHKKFLLIALICLIGIGISFLLFSAHRPFKDLEAADITSASVRLSPPDTTIQIVETEELVSYLNEVVIYNKDNSYTEYAGQAVIFTLSLADGSQVEIIAYNPFIIIDGIGYKCKYEPCEALNHYANEGDFKTVFDCRMGGYYVSSVKHRCRASIPLQRYECRSCYRFVLPFVA